MLYTYEIAYLNDEREFTRDQGVVCATSYSNAVEKIVEYYGEDNIVCFDGLCEQVDLLTIDDLRENWKGI